MMVSVMTQLCDTFRPVRKRGSSDAYKYLLKRAQTNRDGTLRITVINQHPDKDPEVSKQEKQRYERFLGATVNYTELSFGDFAANPMDVVRS